MVLEAVYEQEFLACSYGFRPGRSAHQALEFLRRGLMSMGGGWVLEVDIKSFFDTLSHSCLREFLNQRVRDGVMRRMIDKWLKAGVMEEGLVTHPDTGTPQGGVVSPLLANIYLHEVLDKWFESVIRPRLLGRSFMVRYADDFVLAFSNERDARQVMEVLPKRFGKYGLTLHPTKTRLLRFRPTGQKPDASAGPGSFDFLGFRHYWARRWRGSWEVKRKTMPSRFDRTLKRLARWMRSNRHRPVAEQHRRLAQALRGHYGYYGVDGNRGALKRLKYEVERTWRKWLARRGHRSRMVWEYFSQLLRRYPLPTPVLRPPVALT
jgi:group II intron reverse transcriptase/maturase